MPDLSIDLALLESTENGLKKFLADWDKAYGAKA